jgi:hypothetical protein
MRGESPDAVSRHLNVPLHRLTQWREKGLGAAQSAFKERERDEIVRLHAKAGEITMDNELLCAKIDKLKSGRPLASPIGPAEIKGMSGTQSISSLRACGMSRVCKIRGAPRATVRRRRGPAATAPRPCFVARAPTGPWLSSHRGGLFLSLMV